MQDSDEQKAIEEEFSQSWDGQESFFKAHSAFEGWEWLTAIFDLIADLRSRGYDRKFRAGQSMAWFVLSRSREHGLRNEQSRIWFGLNGQGGMKVTYYENNQTIVEFELDQVAITPEIEVLLERLLAQPID